MRGGHGGTPCLHPREKPRCGFPWRWRSRRRRSVGGGAAAGAACSPIRSRRLSDLVSICSVLRRTRCGSRGAGLRSGLRRGSFRRSGFAGRRRCRRHEERGRRHVSRCLADAHLHRLARVGDERAFDSAQVERGHDVRAGERVIERSRFLVVREDVAGPANAHACQRRDHLEARAVARHDLAGKACIAPVTRRSASPAPGFEARIRSAQRARVRGRSEMRAESTITSCTWPSAGDQHIALPHFGVQGDAERLVPRSTGRRLRRTARGPRLGPGVGPGARRRAAGTIGCDHGDFLAEVVAQQHSAIGLAEGVELDVRAVVTRPRRAAPTTRRQSATSSARRGRRCRRARWRSGWRARMSSSMRRAQPNASS